MKRLMLVELVGPEAGFSVTLGFHVGPGGSSSVKVDNGPEGPVTVAIGVPDQRSSEPFEHVMFHRLPASPDGAFDWGPGFRGADLAMRACTRCGRIGDVDSRTGWCAGPCLRP